MMKSGKLRWWIGAAGVVMIALGVGVAVQDVRQTNHFLILAEPKASTSAKAASPAPALDPLQIEAIRTHTYTASTLTVTQDLGEQGGYMQAVSSFVSDGLTEYALVSTPDGTAPPHGWPVVILAHGYIDPTQYQTASSDYASIIGGLARAGYLVVKPDYRGHGKSAGQAQGGHFSPVYAYDVLNLIATLKHYPAADPARIGLLGHSMGGHVALRTIVVSKDVKATVLMSGVVGSMYDIFYNWPHSPVASDQPKVVTQGARTDLLTKYGTPKTDPAFWDSASAINYVTAVTGAVQIDQSAGDTVVPMQFADHLDAALTAAGKPHDYFMYPGDDHQFSQNHTLFMQRILAFYAAHL